MNNQVEIWKVVSAVVCIGLNGAGLGLIVFSKKRKKLGIILIGVTLLLSAIATQVFNVICPPADTHSQLFS